MPRIDLRHEVPPLGFKAQDVPLADVDFAALNLEQRRLDNPLDSGAPVDVFAHPGSFDLVIRRHSFDPQDASTHDELIAYLRYAEAEHTALTDAGIPVLATRHLEAELPSVEPEIEGELFSLSTRLLIGYEHLDPGREDHVGSSIFVLNGLTRYAKEALSRNPTARPRFLRDVFKAHQFSTGGSGELKPLLHDVDPILEDTQEDSGRPSLSFRAAVGELKDFAEETLATAQGTTDEQQAYKVLREIQTSLPKPYYF